MVVMCSQGWKPVIREIFLSPLKQELLGQLDFIFPYRTLKFINSIFSICRENVENHSLSNMFFPITLQFVQSSLILKIKPNQLTNQPRNQPRKNVIFLFHSFMCQLGQAVGPSYSLKHYLKHCCGGTGHASEILRAHFSTTAIKTDVIFLLVVGLVTNL